MNCQCGKEISSPKLTGESCTTCYFKSKNNEPSVFDDTARPTDLVIEAFKQELEDTFNQEMEEKPPTVSKSSETRDLNLKYCQSCIERGYGLKLATREWRADYFICDECFTPLLNNIMNIGDEDIKKIKENVNSIRNDSPFLTQAYDLLGIPENLRYSKSDQVLNNRNDIFNYHAPALINKSIESVASEIEELSIVLFQIKLAIEPRQDYINKIKYYEREKVGLKGLEKSEKEYTKGPSKLKLSKDEKMAKQLGMPLDKYLEMVKSAKKTEFDKIVNS